MEFEVRFYIIVLLISPGIISAFDLWGSLDDITASQNAVRLTCDANRYLKLGEKFVFDSTAVFNRPLRSIRNLRRFFRNVEGMQTPWVTGPVSHPAFIQSHGTHVNPHPPLSHQYFGLHEPSFANRRWRNPPEICEWNFNSDSSCKLAVHLIYYRRGDPRCSKQYLMLSDSVKEMQVCGSVMPPKTFMSENQRLTVKFFRRPYTYRTVFKGYVTCHEKYRPYPEYEDFYFDEDHHDHHVYDKDDFDETYSKLSDTKQSSTIYSEEVQTPSSYLPSEALSNTFTVLTEPYVSELSQPTDEKKIDTLVKESNPSIASYTENEDTNNPQESEIVIVFPQEILEVIQNPQDQLQKPLIDQYYPDSIIVSTSSPLSITDESEIYLSEPSVAKELSPAEPSRSSYTNDTTSILSDNDKYEYTSEQTKLNTELPSNYQSNTELYIPSTKATYLQGSNTLTIPIVYSEDQLYQNSVKEPVSEYETTSAPYIQSSDIIAPSIDYNNILSYNTEASKIEKSTLKYSPAESNSFTEIQNLPTNQPTTKGADTEHLKYLESPTLPTEPYQYQGYQVTKIPYVEASESLNYLTTVKSYEAVEPTKEAYNSDDRFADLVLSEVHPSLTYENLGYPEPSRSSIYPEMELSLESSTIKYSPASTVEPISSPTNADFYVTSTENYKGYQADATNIQDSPPLYETPEDISIESRAASNNKGSAKPNLNQDVSTQPNFYILNNAPSQLQIDPSILAKLQELQSIRSGIAGLENQNIYFQNPSLGIPGKSTYSVASSWSQANENQGVSYRSTHEVNSQRTESRVTSQSIGPVQIQNNVGGKVYA